MMAESRPIRLVIITADHMVRAGLRMIIRPYPHLTIVAEAPRPSHAIEAALCERADIAVIDVASLGPDVLDQIQQLRNAVPDLLLVVLSHLSDGHLTSQALCAGAAGVVLHVQPPAVLVAMIEALCREAEPLQKRPTLAPPPALMEVRELAISEENHSGTEQLTARQRDVVALLGKGLKNKEIAQQLGISAMTVRHHLTTIFSKLQVADRQQLLLWAHQHQLVDTLIA